MPTHNWTVTAGVTYADAGITGPKDLNIQNRSKGTVEYVVATAQPAGTVLGMLLDGAEKNPVKLAASEKVWLRLGPSVSLTSAVVVAVEVP